MRKIIFFDMGNTLIHFHEKYTDEYKDEQGIIKLTTFLQKYCEDIKEQYIRKVFFGPWIESMKDRKITHREVDVGAYLNAAVKPYDVSLNKSECIESMKQFYKAYEDNINYELGIQNVLEKLIQRGYEIGVISNTALYEEVMIDCFKKAGIDKFIKHYTFSYTLGIGKPSTRIFEEALRKFQVLGSEAIMIGDNIESDIKPAESLGMYPIWYNKDGKSNEAYNGCMITKLADLLLYCK